MSAFLSLEDPDEANEKNKEKILEMYDVFGAWLLASCVFTLFSASHTLLERYLANHTETYHSIVGDTTTHPNAIICYCIGCVI